ncbi:hypothetical protein OH793_01400 [Klebsiella aerogenes]|uniref:hypothetical protein n=1 Tax=Klebsiella aerogenes TaxID=548 RepID=UPI0022EC6FC1|nr:hypothetical protein [Klebsiella aerogenes]MDA3989939.1 hypothetical protein [Klebsiella aerogenes]
MSSITPAEVGSFALSLVGPIIIGVAAAGFTAYFALRRFYREKWWEKKYQAYDDLIGILYELQILHRNAIIEYRFKRYLDEEPPIKVDLERWQELEASVKKMLAFSPMKLTSSTQGYIKEYLDQVSSRDSKLRNQHIKRDIILREVESVIISIIPKIVEEARVELKNK